MTMERCTLLAFLLLLAGCNALSPERDPPSQTTLVVTSAPLPAEPRPLPATPGSSGIVRSSSAASSGLSIASGELATASSASEVAPLVISPCRLPEIAGIDAARIYAAGAYKGRELPFRIDESRHAATQFDVLVNSPDAAVVLLLGAYEPSIWNIEWTPGTRILAVVTAGYHRQRVAGLDANATPVLLSAYADGGPCDYFYIGSDDAGRVNRLAQLLFGRNVALAYGADGAGRVVVGNVPAPGTRNLRGKGPTPESFRY